MKDRRFRQVCNKDYSYDNMANVLIAHCPDLTDYINNNRGAAMLPRDYL